MTELSDQLATFYQQKDNLDEKSSLQKAVSVMNALHNSQVLSDILRIGKARQMWLDREAAYMKERDHQVQFQLHETKYYRLYQYQESGIINMLHASHWLCVDFPNLTILEAIMVQAYWMLRYEDIQNIWKKDAINAVAARTFEDVRTIVENFVF